MITRPSLRLATVVMLGAVWSAACQKVPLLAPSGSTIVLTASNNAVGANGTVELIAQVLEPSGTPPHQGTHVTFSTTLGVIEPADATTDVNGQARATFKANGSNGTATITAISGGAGGGSTGTTNNTNTTTTSTPTNVVRISVGTAAVGRITLTANPATISSNGGTATVTANVVDVNGNALVAVPVTFATSAGALGASVVNTDGTGTATTPLTTAVEATVTASVGAAGGAGGGTGGNTGGNAGGNGGSTGGSTSGQTTATVTVRVNPLPTVSVSATGTHTVGSPVTFTIKVTQPTNSIGQIRDVRVSFGDGDVVSLGSATGDIVVQHVYDEEDTYSVTARATDTLGGVAEGGTVIVVQGQVPVVTISFTRVAVGTTWDYTFVANVFPAGTTIVSYAWDFGDGASQTTSFNTVSHTYPQGSPSRTVRVTVTRPNGQQASSSTTITN